MASVWCAMAHERKDQKVAGHLPMADALTKMREMAANWASLGPHRKVAVVSNLEVHMLARRNGRDAVVGHLWVEPYSPPSAPADGDIYRSAKPTGA